MGLTVFAYFAMHALFSALLMGLVVAFAVGASALRYASGVEPPVMNLTEQPFLAVGVWVALTAALLAATLWRERRRAGALGHTLRSYAALAPAERARLDDGRGL